MLRSAVGLFGFTRSATTRAWGTSSDSSSSLLSIRSTFRTVKPVALPPGWARLATSPSPTGSEPVRNTIGIVEVVFFAANVEGAAIAAITSTLRPTRSAANAGSRSYWPSAQRYSIATFRPSTQPVSANPWWNAATNPAASPGDLPLSKPITGICCARRTRGAMAAPPKRRISSRRFIDLPCPDPPSASDEYRCALLGPRSDTLGVVCRCATRSADGRERVAVERAGGGLVDRAFQPGDSERRIGGQGCRERFGARHQLVWWHDLIEIADAQHLGGIDRLGGQKQLLCRRDTKPVHIAADAARIINDAEPGRRHQEAHPLNADTKIAGERQIRCPAINAAVERGDGRHTQCLEPVDHALERIAVLRWCGPAGQAIGERADVEARTEAFPRASQHQDADRRLRIDAIKGLAQHHQIGGFEPVVLARAVEAHHRAAIRYIDQRRRRLAAGFRIVGHQKSFRPFPATASV